MDRTIDRDTEVYETPEGSRIVTTPVAEEEKIRASPDAADPVVTRSPWEGLCIVRQEDMEELRPLIRTYCSTSSFPGELDEDFWIQTWSTLLDLGRAFIGGLRGADGRLEGFLASILYIDPIDGATVAAVQGWYLRDSARRDERARGLLKACEVVMRDRGATRMVLGHMVRGRDRPRVAARLMRRHGYRPFEMVYTKEL